MTDPSYKVKNTFLEVSVPEDPAIGETRGRRTRSDVAGHSQVHNTQVHHSPLVVASKSPTTSPGLHPVDEEMMKAVPIDEVDFELLEEAAPADFTGGDRYGEHGDNAMVAQQSPGLGRDEPAYVVPTTPSPFLHSAFPPTVVPPFGGYGMGGYGLPDMGLPPAYGAEGEMGDQDGGGQYMQDANGQYMQGMQFMPEMYDPSCAPYMPYWPGMPMNGQNYVQEGFNVGGHVGPDGMFVPGEAFDPQAQAVAGVGGEGAGAGEGREKGRRGKNKKKDQMGEAAGGGAGTSSSGRGGEKAPAAQVKPGDLDMGSAANQAAMDAEEDYTTVMLRNIPNKYTREMLIKQLCVDFNGMFDFMYLPIDFKNKCNVGYGFINFRTQDACVDFVQSFHGVAVGKCLPGLNSKKIVEVTPARVQGLVENVRRLRNSPVMNQLVDHPEWMPLLFNELGQQEPFPNPDQPLPPVKPRGRARVEAAA